jgi:hypothetical protein
LKQSHEILKFNIIYEIYLHYLEKLISEKLKLELKEVDEI